MGLIHAHCNNFYEHLQISWTCFVLWNFDVWHSFPRSRTRKAVNDGCSVCTQKLFHSISFWTVNERDGALIKRNIHSKSHHEVTMKRFKQEAIQVEDKTMTHFGPLLIHFISQPDTILLLCDSLLLFPSKKYTKSHVNSMRYDYVISTVYVQRRKYFYPKK